MEESVAYSRGLNWREKSLSLSFCFFVLLWRAMSTWEKTNSSLDIVEQYSRKVDDGALFNCIPFHCPSLSCARLFALTRGACEMEHRKHFIESLPRSPKAQLCYYKHLHNVTLWTFHQCCYLHQPYLNRIWINRTVFIKRQVYQNFIKFNEAEFNLID